MRFETEVIIGSRTSSTAVSSEEVEGGMSGVSSVGNVVGSSSGGGGVNGTPHLVTSVSDATDDMDKVLTSYFDKTVNSATIKVTKQ